MVNLGGANSGVDLENKITPEFAPLTFVLHCYAAFCISGSFIAKVHLQTKIKRF